MADHPSMGLEPAAGTGPSGACWSGLHYRVRACTSGDDRCFCSSTGLCARLCCLVLERWSLHGLRWCSPDRWDAALPCWNIRDRTRAASRCHRESAPRLSSIHRCRPRPLCKPCQWEGHATTTARQMSVLHIPAPSGGSRFSGGMGVGGSLDERASRWCAPSAWR
jgi:hypothetical protein